jgi:hypothetical protein
MFIGACVLLFGAVPDGSDHAACAELIATASTRAPSTRLADLVKEMIFVFIEIIKINNYLQK